VGATDVKAMSEDESTMSADESTIKVGGRRR
jgi:hypothetical protein